MGFYAGVSGLVPKFVREAYKQQLYLADVRLETRSFVGFLLMMALVLGSGLGIGAKLLFNLPPAPAFILVFLGVMGLPYMLLNLSADGKGKYVEGILPDALQLISSNVRAGLTTERAMLVSARPEFGPLERALKNAAAEIMSGIPAEVALLNLPKRIKSKVLQQTMWLLSRGMVAGGEISDLLLQLSGNLRDQNALEEESKANVSTYIILIFFSAAIGAPALYAVSSFIVEIMIAQRPVGVEQAAAAGGIAAAIASAPKTKIGADFVINFIMVALFLGSMFAALVMGVINSGNEKQGLKYMPALLALAFLVFFLVRAGLTTVFGDILL